MRIIYLMGCILLGCVIMAPCTSLAALLHISNSAMSGECIYCHPDGTASTHRDCIECHNNTSGGGYTPYNTIGVQTHSSDVIGSLKYAPWSRECLDCHDNHLHNMLDKNLGVIDPSYVLADITVNFAENDFTNERTTFNSLQIDNIQDPDWTDPATWAEKTSNERGLVFVCWVVNQYKWFEVTNATATTMTIGNYVVGFPSTDNPISGKLAYGMLIRGAAEPINGTVVTYYGPRSMANDESETGEDPTPYGVCQVCHTQTTHWRSDGSLANHFSGWYCAMCHPHAQGFKPVIPDLCPLRNE